MKNTALLKTILFVTILSSPNIWAQEISIAEAFDSTDVSWSVTVGPRGGGDPYDDAESENYWHPVTDVTHDGIDALRIRMPDHRNAVSKMNAVVQGPIQFSFWYKTDPEEYGYIHAYWKLENTNHGSGSGWLRSEEWTQQTISIREQGNFILHFDAIGSELTEDWNAWIDKFAYTSAFPPDITDFPLSVGAPIGRPIKLEVEAAAYGEMSYRWFRNGIETSGENEASILVPASEALTDTKYQVEVSDELGSILSPEATVQFLSLNEVLDNDVLTFSIPDIPGQNYAQMIVLGENSFDGEDAIYLRECGRNCTDEDKAEYIFTSEEITTTVQGPTILSFYFKDTITTFLNGENQNPFFGEYSYTESFGEWTKAYIPIPDAGSNSVTWSARTYPINYGSRGVIDEIALTQTPVFLSDPTQKSTVAGLDNSLDYRFINVGEIIHQLVKDEQVFLESTNEPINLSNLTPADSGTYKVKLINEFGESVSDSFELNIYNTIGEAVEQPDLEWVYEGEKIWIPQIYETYDGEDAAALLNEGDGQGSVATIVNGPALVSFWMKSGHTFHVNGNEEQFSTESPNQWEKLEVVLKKETNELKWYSGFFDRLEIEPIETIGNAVEQPSLEWNFSGNRIWVAQSDDSYDGEDAAMLADFGSGEGSVYTDIPGPAIVSFWWKDGGTFINGERAIQYQGEGCQQEKTVIFEELGRLTWNKGYLDKIHIENLSNDPLKQWAFANFGADEVLNDFEAVIEGDRDFDSLINFLEWALNKNLDFPNPNQAYEFFEEDGKLYLGITYSRQGNLGQFTVYLEASDDMNNWEKIESVISETYHEFNDTYTVAIRDTKPIGEGGRFMRLVVTDEQ